ncbi:MAG: UDP-N-acetylmuramoyl-tripeptide--D-alanyl-D-alanine ligase, partial [Bryobacteraceae bacterium]|nr:UDP-N-acetylmuramoyl-tripeptide--D-alanyl-D-alanine ligase [Bryobacteraceae bacterium]
DPRVRAFAAVHSGRSLTYGLDPASDLHPTRLEFAADRSRFTVDSTDFETSLIGRHGVMSVLAALALAREFGIPLAHTRDAVHALTPPKMRGERIEVRGTLVLNDCYNSNPDAARAMLDVLRDLPAQRRIAVLGEMLELGHWAEPLHREVGQYAVASGISVLVGIRGAARCLVEAAVSAGLDAGAALFFEEPTPAGDYLRSVAQPGDAILFKGSRGTRVELALARFIE